jgi:uncharacterized RDD family membrane protein YckC
VSENGPLDDFPLWDGTPGAAAGHALGPVGASEEPVPAGAAPLSSRLPAAAADAATVLLLAALAILAARLATGESPRLSGLVWVIGFLLYLWAFATVVPIMAFGRTVGMALADLSARPVGSHAGLTAPEALRRWLGTLATAATGGLLLLWSARDPRAPTPADRLSGCALTLD